MRMAAHCGCAAPRAPPSESCSRTPRADLGLQLFRLLPRDAAATGKNCRARNAVRATGEKRHKRPVVDQTRRTGIVDGSLRRRKRCPGLQGRTGSPDRRNEDRGLYRSRQPAPYRVLRGSMCLILFAHRAAPGYALVLAANRDEFFSRPSATADYWKHAPHVLAGRDLEKGGTWMGVTRQGRWAAVTNFRDGSRASIGSRSRGELVARYLLGASSAAAYAAAAATDGADFQGFNLLVGDRDGVYCVSNRGAQPQALEPGIYGLSN